MLEWQLYCWYFTVADFITNYSWQFMKRKCAKKKPWWLETTEWLFINVILKKCCSFYQTQETGFKHICTCIFKSTMFNYKVIYTTFSTQVIMIESEWNVTTTELPDFELDEKIWLSSNIFRITRKFLGIKHAYL